MDDDTLARAWESFATALSEVPARRMERLLRRPTSLADFGQSRQMQESMRYQALALQGAMEHYRYRGIRPGIFGLGLTL